MQRALHSIDQYIGELGANRDLVFHFDGQNHQGVLDYYDTFRSTAGGVLPMLVAATSDEILIRKLVVIQKMNQLRCALMQGGGAIWTYHQLSSEGKKMSLDAAARIFGGCDANLGTQGNSALSASFEAVTGSSVFGNAIPRAQSPGCGRLVQSVSGAASR
jgi:hypothetical protein